MEMIAIKFCVCRPYSESKISTAFTAKTTNCCWLIRRDNSPCRKSRPPSLLRKYERVYMADENHSVRSFVPSLFFMRSYPDFIFIIIIIINMCQDISARKIFQIARGKRK